jgi:pilus assembly protein CpaE
MRTVVASDDQTISNTAREVLLREGHECQIAPLVPIELLTNRLTKLQPEMLLVVLSPDPEPALAALQESRSTISGPVVAIGPASASKLRLRAFQGGADHYLESAELEAELEVILGRLKVQKPAPAEPTEPGRLICLLGPSGGSGSSTLAVNLATVLAKEHKSCALFDLRLGGGDLAALLDLKPTHTLADLCRNSPRMDRVMFERSLVRHECGVQLLSPPRAFADIGLVTTQGVRQALTLARSLFPYVVVDLDDSFHPEQTQTLSQTDLVLLVLRLDFTSLRNTRRTLDHLDQMGISREKVRIVANRYGQPQELPATKAEQALGMKIAFYVPDDPKTINRANNNGVPAVLEYPSAKFSKSVQQLATGVNGRLAAR